MYDINDKIAEALNYEPGDVLAVKIWTKADALDIFRDEFGYDEEDVTDDMMQDVINTGYLKTLEECTEEEWDMFRWAIRDVLKMRNLIEDR